MKEGGRGHELDIYLGSTAGASMVLASGRLQRQGLTALCRNKRRPLLKAPESWR